MLNHTKNFQSRMHEFAHLSCEFWLEAARVETALKAIRNARLKQQASVATGIDSETLEAALEAVDNIQVGLKSYCYALRPDVGNPETYFFELLADITPYTFDPRVSFNLIGSLGTLHGVLQAELQGIGATELVWEATIIDVFNCLAYYRWFLTGMKNRD